MKKIVKNTLLGVLGTSLGMYMMAAPLATTVYANAHEVPLISNQMHGEHGTQSPLKVVKASANKMGFDVKSDSFTLVSETTTAAVVNVVHDDTSYNVTLERSKGGDQEKGRDQQQGGGQEKGRNQQQGGDQEKGRDKQQGGGQEKGRNQQQGGGQEKGRDQQQGGGQEKGRDQQQGGGQEKGRNQKQDRGQEKGQWIITSVNEA